MTPEVFIAKWRDATLSERSGAQSHFNELCELLGVKKPSEADRHGEAYTFEKSVTKPDGRQGRADVWKRGCFAWEYKGAQKNLVRAYSQLKEYADALENPPLLIVSDMKEIRIHTNFTNSIARTISIPILDLNDPGARQTLRAAFDDPESLRPSVTREAVTAHAAEALGELAQILQRRQHDKRQVAHFLNKLVFSMFVEDVGLLPQRIFSDVLEEALEHESEFAPMLGDLFRAMRLDRGRFGKVQIPWFNGGLFDDDDVIPLNSFDIRRLARAARLDWGAIEPSIFGTLFERGLDAHRRKEMAGLFEDEGEEPYESGPSDLFAENAVDRAVGIYYTDAEKIMRIVEPAVLRPLSAEWEAAKAEIACLPVAERGARYLKFRERLGRFRVLDPACGSGNFLYLALVHLKDFDLAVAKEAASLGLPADGERVGPHTVLGIEVNPYAAELARVTVWIGELQWQVRHDFTVTRRPILDSLKGIVCRDALINADDTEATWPTTDAIIGNPPFLGGKRLRDTLGDPYVDRLFKLYVGRVPAEADLVCYWFAKAKAALGGGRTKHVGLVATNSIRGGANRQVLDRLYPEYPIFEAWDDEAWVVDGAAVRVSLVCFRPSALSGVQKLNGREVTDIHADLTAGAANLTLAHRLTENRGVAFMGDTKGGAFDVPGALARQWLKLPLNPNGRPNADVLRPWVNGMDVTRRSADKWIIDFGWKMSEQEASLYEAPFAHVREHVKPERDNNRRDAYRVFWWRHVEARQGLMRALSTLPRHILTARVSKYRLFVWMPHNVLPDSATIAVARDDDATFGVLHSRFHEVWALRLGTWLGVGNDPRYTPSTTFETFPFPEGLTPNTPAAAHANDPRAQAIAEAARRLDELRRAWLNPPDLIDVVPEIVPGFPDRILPKSNQAAAMLKKRTLTNLYNQRPPWLDNAHKVLDAAVAAAYGWSPTISDDEALARLFELNKAR